MAILDERIEQAVKGDADSGWEVYYTSRSNDWNFHFMMGQDELDPQVRGLDFLREATRSLFRASFPEIVASEGVDVFKDQAFR
tara:strand:- start:46 stop:294 length:249 start_codon:yes stop_codon:yes gene_type:complete